MDVLPQMEMLYPHLSLEKSIVYLTPRPDAIYNYPDNIELPEPQHNRAHFHLRGISDTEMLVVRQTPSIRNTSITYAGFIGYTRAMQVSQMLGLSLKIFLIVPDIVEDYVLQSSRFKLQGKVIVHTTKSLLNLTTPM